ncbi:NADPH-dependent FMN reductase [Nonomuraea sp. NPDC050547]|uniref:NADPH-dependent FMN reductase n=1 Tax=Nonomuraea sp. NPDC050547 TaxID=3364368 RepID=UPI003789D579
MIRLAVIVASTRHGRFGPTVAAWLTAKARRRADLVIDLVDLAETRLPQDLTDPDEPLPPRVAALAPRLAAADAFAVVTPEYNRSFPAPLKTAIDWYYEEWRAKPVAFVGYGRESGGHHAISQLRQVFTELDAVGIREAVTLPCYWELFAADGTWPKATATCNAELNHMLERLSWWAHTLREARLVKAQP